MAEWQAIGRPALRTAEAIRPSCHRNIILQLRRAVAQPRDAEAHPPGENVSDGNGAFHEPVCRRFDADAYVESGLDFMVLSIDGATPSVESVQKKTYPYARPTFFYTNGEPAGLVKAFVDFTLSSAGQKIVGDVGFVPIK